MSFVIDLKPRTGAETWKALEAQAVHLDGGIDVALKDGNLVAIRFNLINGTQVYGEMPWGDFLVGMAEVGDEQSWRELFEAAERRK